MKRLIFFCVFWGGVISCALADRLSIENVTIEGRQGIIQIHFQFDTPELYCGYEMILQLPEGVSTVKDNSGAPIFVEGDCYDDSYLISTNHMDGKDKFVALSLKSNPMSGTEGVLLSIPVLCNNSLQTGTELKASLYDIQFGKTDGISTVNMDNVSFDIVIGNPWITLDENATTLPMKSDGEVELKVKRSILANQWNTICLPFAMTEEQVYEAFGEDVKLAEFIEYEVNDDNSRINVFFESALLSKDGFMANYPYIIKTSKDVTEFTVTSILEPDEAEAYAEYTNGRSGSRKEVYGTFYGTLKAGTILPMNSIFMNSGKFWYSAGMSKMKAYRGYFDFVDVLGSTETASSQMKMVFKENTTGVEQIIEHQPTDRTYDLQGRAVKNPQTGIYIQGGKKYIVR